MTKILNPYGTGSGSGSGKGRASNFLGFNKIDKAASFLIFCIKRRKKQIYQINLKARK